MIPEVSKLNWSTQKPTFEEVKGKTVFMAWDFCEGVTDFKSQEISTKADFNSWFDKSHPIRYAILDLTPPDPEPLPLWGVMPNVLPANFVHRGEWFVACDVEKGDDSFEITTFCHPTRAEAIEAWNKISTRLADIPPKEEQRNE